MRVSDVKLDEVRERGFAIVEGFISGEALRAAQDALWEIYPRPTEFFADPDRHATFSSSRFAGIRHFPYPSWALNQLTVLPDLVDAAERFCHTAELSLYKVELWGKYSGASTMPKPTIATTPITCWWCPSLPAATCR